ncbi:MAG: efflux RND transporter periplasmic adaptor subunit [bacterium]|nr:efflux RND transporter periplasmic adaptor subunit [bacterium]
MVKQKKTGGAMIVQMLALSFFILSAIPSLCFAKGNSTDSPVKMPVRGVVRSAAEAVISTDLTALITRIGFKEGERFRKGDLLIALDCRQTHAELASAKAQHREMKVALKSVLFLKKRNASSRHEVETTRARSDRANAQVDAIRAQVDKCKIIAPFDGRVAELGAHEHEITVAGKPLFSIVAVRTPKMELIVPSHWLTWLKTGSRFQFQIDETRTNHTGEVTRLGAIVDTVSQTIKIFGKFTSPIANILPGMSGTAEFQSLNRDRLGRGGFHE